MTTGLATVPATDMPYFGARWAAGRVEVFGTPRHARGRRIAVPGQALDDGVFVEWRWDGRQLVVENDRHGFLPLFYSCVGQEIWVSTTMDGVLRGNSRRGLDLAALAVFFRFGQFIGDDTALEDVRFLPPNSTLVWRDGVATLTRRPEPVAVAYPRGLNFDDAVDAYAELFAQAITRRLPQDDRFTVPISGGRDSRHILLELARQGRVPASCMTVKYRPPATNEDNRIARLLTERLGIAHVQLDKPASFFEATRQDVFLTNYCGGGHGWIQPVAGYLSGRFETTYDGLAGDELSALLIPGDPKLALFRGRRLTELAAQLLDETRQEKANEGLLAGSLYRRMPRGLAIERMAQELKNHADSHSPVVSFNFWNRTRRCIASIPFAILSGVPLVHCPFLDHRLFDFLIGLDPALIAGKGFHDAAILRAYPDFADIPFEDKSLKAPWTLADRHYYRRSRIDMLAYLVRQHGQARATLKPGWLVAKTLVDVLRNVAESPWYMRNAVYAIELQALIER